ncbi:MAG: rhomboid family intramembrane serine protease [Bacteroidia bacterium]
MMVQLPPGLKNLLILIALMGMAQLSLPNVGFDVFQFYLYYPDSPNFQPWQLITHIFCHGGIGHFLFNMIALFSFGGIVEYRMGTQRFLTLFFLAGLGAALLHLGIMGAELQSAYGTLFPNKAAGVDFQPYGPMLGASGALYGVMTAFAMYYPNESMIFLFIPYPIKAKYLVPGMIVLDLVFGIGGTGTGIAHFAHVGGALTGFIAVWIWKRKGQRLF